MLLYNNKQEFVGISDEGLRLLNYSSLDELLSVCTDVADLFANEPGYIHNFKNFGWIDFLLHADSDASSAIVHANGRTFSCLLSVTPFHLCSQPSENGYSIDLTQIKSLSGEEIKPHIITPKVASPEFTAPSAPVTQTIPTPLPDYSHLTPTQLSEPTVLDIPKTAATSYDETDDIYASLMAPLSDEEMDTVDAKPQEKNIAPQVSEPAVVPQIAKRTPMLGSAQYSTDEAGYLAHHKVSESYSYDPHVAANELGLPVDLIEEFIGDFIQQSHDFQSELFEAAAKNDYSTIHILSHKLKGVAANLRVENAFETLSVINISNEPVEILANLKYYYGIIAKLDGQENQEVQQESIKNNQAIEEKPSAAITLEALDDIYAFALKQNDEESIIVHDEEIHETEASAEKVIETDDAFKKVLVDLPDEEEVSLVIEEPSQKTDAPLHYDHIAIAGALGIEPDFMAELLHDYKTDAYAMSTTILKAIKAFDTHTWRASAAKLKGISDNLRLSEISDELAILSITNDAQEAKKASARLISYLDQL